MLLVTWQSECGHLVSVLYFATKPNLSAGRFSFPWNVSVANSRQFLDSHLYTIHPVLQKTLENFQISYARFRVIDLELMKTLMPFTIDQFKREALAQIDKAQAYLKENWLRQCQQTVVDHQELIESLMPAGSQVSTFHLESSR